MIEDISVEMNASDLQQQDPARLILDRTGPDTLSLVLSGIWRLDQSLPDDSELTDTLAGNPALKRLLFNTENLSGWDSGMMTFLLKVSDMAVNAGLSVDYGGLPDGARRLLQLTAAAPKRTDAAKATVADPLFARIGGFASQKIGRIKNWIDFIGEATIALTRFLTGKATFRSSDLFLIIQEVGAEALPIVTLISVLIGLILAFVGAVQLALFGAQLYVANLVAIAMLREMGAMMTGIIMAGRTGAAFAAQLGTMQVNEEIDALKTLGIQPMEFLVLPRMLALILMMPLLCIYSDLLGLVGGAIVGIGTFDLTIVQYFEQTRSSIQLNHFLIGVGKSITFGIVIALAGCLRGMECGRSATAVGHAATSAVVTSIIVIIALDGLFAVMTNALGI